MYGQERGSTHVWGGKGKGKTGRKRKRAPTKRKQQKDDGAEREGWQDPEVLRALRGEAPSGVHKALDDTCKREVHRQNDTQHHMSSSEEVAGTT